MGAVSEFGALEVSGSETFPARRGVANRPMEVHELQTDVHEWRRDGVPQRREVPPRRGHGAPRQNFRPTQTTKS